MPNYELGKVLRMAREARKMTQGQLVELYDTEAIKKEDTGSDKEEAKEKNTRNEICSTQVLHRIENGTAKEIKMDVLYQLMEKVGLLPEQMYPSILVTKPLALNLKAEIHNLIQQREYKKAKKDLQKLEGMMVPEYPRNEQYLMYTKAKLAFQGGELEVEEYLKTLFDALSITVPILDQVDIAEWPLNCNEILILFDISNVYHLMKDREKELELLLKLKKNVEKQYMDSAYYAAWHTYILSELSRLMCLRQNYEEALKLCMVGIEECKEYNILGNIHQLLYDMVWCKEQKIRNNAFSDEMESEEQKLFIKKEREFCKKQLVQAYYLCKAQGDFSAAERIKRLGKKLYPDDVKLI